MIYEQRIGALYGDDGKFIKTIYCPMAVRLRDLVLASPDSPDRRCHSCGDIVHSINEMTDDDVRTLVKSKPNACVFATAEARNIIFLSPIQESGRFHFPPPLPVVQTARSLEVMQDGHKRGLRLVIRRTGTETDVGRKLQVWQHTQTGELWASGDYRSYPPLAKGEELGAWIVIADWFRYQPDRLFPLAAYLVPADLEAGTRVFLDDLIEDFPVVFWNQGDSYRAPSAEATWTGEDIEVTNPGRNVPMVLG